jgi:hypothetical protein
MYVIHNLSWGDPTLPHCFRMTIDEIHRSAIYCLFNGPIMGLTPPTSTPPFGPLEKARILLDRQDAEWRAEHQHLQQQQIERERQVRQEAKRLLEQRELLDLVQKMLEDNPELIRKKLAANQPIMRFIAVQIISKRRLPFEKDLIERFNDPDPAVRLAAHNALVYLTRGTDFGPVPGASRRGVERAVEKWRHWLELQKSASPEVLAKSAAKAAGKPVKAEPIDIVPLILEPAERRAPKESPNELLNAKGEAQLALLARLRDGADDDNTVVLALAIPKLNGDVRHQARLSASALRDKLQDDDLEVRRAAALACGRKLAKDLIGDLITLLNDPEMDAVQSARAALTELTGEDFGPTRDAVRRERDEAVAAWRKWWKQQDKRP